MKQLFAKIPLFAEFSDDELADIVSLASTRGVQKKNVILQEGDTGNALYVILEGSVKISYYAPDGREIILSILRSGDFFGEIALLDNQPRSATVTTLEHSKLVQIRHKEFNRLLLDRPHLTLKILQEVANRLRQTNQVLERFCTMDVPHRLYNFLKETCCKEGAPTVNGQTIISLPTHQIIADQLSTSRETISRAVGALKKDNIIQAVPGSKKIAVDLNAIDTLLMALH